MFPIRLLPRFVPPSADLFFAFVFALVFAFVFVV